MSLQDENWLGSLLFEEKKIADLTHRTVIDGRFARRF
jgi:hypothetical protein